MPPHARAGSVGRGHRFAAYPRCSADACRIRSMAIVTLSRLAVALYACIICGVFTIGLVLVLRVATRDRGKALFWAGVFTVPGVLAGAVLGTTALHATAIASRILCSVVHEEVVQLAARLILGVTGIIAGVTFWIAGFIVGWRVGGEFAAGRGIREAITTSLHPR